MYAKYFAYMPNLVGIFLSGTYLTITGEVNVEGGCGLACMCNMLGPQTHITFYQCELYLKCGNHICQ